MIPLERSQKQFCTELYLRRKPSKLLIHWLSQTSYCLLIRNIIRRTPTRIRISPIENLVIAYPLFVGIFTHLVATSVYCLSLGNHIICSTMCALMTFYFVKFCIQLPRPIRKYAATHLTRLGTKLMVYSQTMGMSVKRLRQ